MMEAARTSETLVNFYQTTRRYNPEDSHLRTHRRENLKSYTAEIQLTLYMHEQNFSIRNTYLFKNQKNTSTNKISRNTDFLASENFGHLTVAVQISSAI
jgi:hypothetical protein